jgi:hypothetical protein
VHPFFTVLIQATEAAELTRSRGLEKNMQRRLLSALVTALLLVVTACGSVVEAPDELTVAKATTITSVEKTFVHVALLYPCGDEGPVVLTFSGTHHTVSHTTIDANGGFHLMVHQRFNATNPKYRVTRVSNNTINVTGDSLPFEQTVVNNFRIKGQGPGNDYLVHMTTHLTVDANGRVTAEVLNTRAVCK